MDKVIIHLLWVAVAIITLFVFHNSPKQFTFNVKTEADLHHSGWLADLNYLGG